jgi:hypothetical protein
MTTRKERLVQEANARYADFGEVRSLMGQRPTNTFETLQQWDLLMCARHSTNETVRSYVRGRGRALAGTLEEMGDKLQTRNLTLGSALSVAMYWSEEALMPPLFLGGVDFQDARSLVNLTRVQIFDQIHYHLREIPQMASDLRTPPVATLWNASGQYFRFGVGLAATIVGVDRPRARETLSETFLDTPQMDEWLVGDHIWRSFVRDRPMSIEHMKEAMASLASRWNMLNVLRSDSEGVFAVEDSADLEDLVMELECLDTLLASLTSSWLSRMLLGEDIWQAYRALEPELVELVRSTLQEALDMDAHALADADRGYDIDISW